MEDDEQSVSCRYCSVSFTKREYLLHRVTNSHIKRLKTTLDFKAICRSCCLTLIDTKKVEAHIEEERHRARLKNVTYVGSTNTCDTCGVVFQSELAMEVHYLMLSHVASASLPPEVPKLTELFSQLSGLPEVNLTTFQSSLCAICDKLFDALDKMVLHFFEPGHYCRLRSSSCIICKKEFTHVNDRETHLLGFKHQSILRKSNRLLEAEYFQSISRKHGHICMFCMIWCHSWFTMELHLMDSYHHQVVREKTSQQLDITKINFSLSFDAPIELTASCDVPTINSWRKWRGSSDEMSAWCHRCGIVLGSPYTVNEHLKEHSTDRMPLASKSHPPSTELDIPFHDDLFECSYCLVSFKTNYGLGVHNVYFEHHRRIGLACSNEVCGCCSRCGVLFYNSGSGLTAVQGRCMLTGVASLSTGPSLKAHGTSEFCGSWCKDTNVMNSPSAAVCGKQMGVMTSEKLDEANIACQNIRDAIGGVNLGSGSFFLAETMGANEDLNANFALREYHECAQVHASVGCPCLGKVMEANNKPDANKDGSIGEILSQSGFQRAFGHGAFEREGVVEGAQSTLNHEANACKEVHDMDCCVENGAHTNEPSSPHNQGLHDESLMQKHDFPVPSVELANGGLHKDLMSVGPGDLGMLNIDSTCDRGVSIDFCQLEKHPSLASAEGDVIMGEMGGQYEAGFTSEVPHFPVSPNQLPTPDSQTLRETTLPSCKEIKTEGVSTDIPVFAAAGMVPLQSLQHSLQSVMAVVSEAVLAAASVQRHKPAMRVRCKRKETCLKVDPEAKRKHQQMDILHASLCQSLQSAGSEEIEIMNVGVKGDVTCEVAENPLQSSVDNPSNLVIHDGKAIFAVAAAIIPNSSRVLGCEEQASRSHITDRGDCSEKLEAQLEASKSVKPQVIADQHNDGSLCFQKFEAPVETTKLNREAPGKWNNTEIAAKVYTHENGANNKVEMCKQVKELGAEMQVELCKQVEKNVADMHPVSDGSDSSDSDDCYRFLEDLRSQEHWWMMSESEESSETIHDGID